MKKFVFSLLLIMIVAGAAFLFGYLPMWIDAGEHAVLLSKTNGWEHPILQPGDFVWAWQGLLPTNLKLFPFTLEKREVSLSVAEDLPSGELYAAYSEGPVEFSYRVSLEVSYRLRPEPLPDLFSEYFEPEDEIDPEALLDEIYTALDKRITRILADRSRAVVEQGDFSLTSSSFQDRLQQTLEQEIPEIESIELLIGDYRFPDLDLYRTAKENYLTFAARSHEVTMSTISEAASTRAAESSRIEILKEYGRLLEEYPILMEYFSNSGGELSLIPLPENQ